MSLSTSRLAYTECYDIFDRAFESPTGIRVPVADDSVGYKMTLHMHQARKLDRQENLKVYPLGHPMHGCSQYDKLMVRLVRNDEGVWLYVEPRGMVDMDAIEPIPEGPHVVSLPSAPEQRLLPSPQHVENIKRRV